MLTIIKGCVHHERMNVQVRIDFAINGSGRFMKEVGPDEVAGFLAMFGNLDAVGACTACLAADGCAG